MFHTQRSSDPKLHKREVTIHLHDTSFSPSHGLREDLCCGSSRRINPDLNSNTFVSGMTAGTIILAKIKNLCTKDPFLKRKISLKGDFQNLKFKIFKNSEKISFYGKEF